MVKHFSDQLEKRKGSFNEKSVQAKEKTNGLLFRVV
jgi:hypothetical protein